MKVLRGFIPVGSVLVILACGGTGGGEVQEMADACASTTNLGAELCECIANKAKEELTDDGFAMLLAMLNEDEAKAAELRGTLSMEDVMAAGMFMTSAPSDCAAESEGS